MNAPRPQRPRIEDAIAHAKELELVLRYCCDLRELSPPLGERFVQFGVDESLASYFERARLERHGSFMTWLHHAMRGFLSDWGVVVAMAVLLLFSRPPVRSKSAMMPECARRHGRERLVSWWLSAGRRRTERPRRPRPSRRCR